MSPKRIIEKLTPAHFENGENFDKETFASLIDALQKSQSTWKVPVIWLVGILLALMFAGIGGAIGYFMAVVCIFAGMIIGNLSVMGLARKIKAVKKELGITQNDINAAIKRVKAESKLQELEKTTVPAESEQKHQQTSASSPTKAARTLFIISCVLVLLLHALLIIEFIANAIDRDPNTGQYSIFAIGSVLAIIGVVLMMKKRLWAYALVLTGIVLFCVGMGDELYELIIILALMMIFSVLLLFSALWLRRKEQQASGVESKPYHLFWMAGMAAAMVLAIALLPERKYENTYWAYDLYQAQLRATGKWGFIDRTKKQVIVPCVYDEADRTYRILKVKLDGKWGAFNKSGNQIIPCRYDFIGDEFSDSLLYVSENGKHGLVTFDGREAVPCVYDEPLLVHSSSDLLKAVLDGKHGFIDRGGNVVVPVQYDNAEFIAGRGFWADLKGERNYFDLEGKRVNYDPAAVAQVQADKTNEKMMKVEYDSQKETFIFTDTETGNPLEYSRIMLGSSEPVEMRYQFSQHGGSMIQFVLRAKEVLETRQEEGKTVTTYREESTTSFPLYNELPYTLEEGILTIRK